MNHWSPRECLNDGPVGGLIHWQIFVRSNKIHCFGWRTKTVQSKWDLKLDPSPVPIVHSSHLAEALVSHFRTSPCCMTYFVQGNVFNFLSHIPLPQLSLSETVREFLLVNFPIVPTHLLVAEKHILSKILSDNGD